MKLKKINKIIKKITSKKISAQIITIFLLFASLTSIISSSESLQAFPLDEEQGLTCDECLEPSFSQDQTPQTIQESNKKDKTLEHILNSYLGPTTIPEINLSTDQYQIQKFDFTECTESVNLEIEFVGKDGGFKNIFGYYYDSNPDTFTSIFRSGNKVNKPDKTLIPGQTIKINILKESYTHLGFGLRSVGNDNPSNSEKQKYFTEKNLNPDQEIHHIIFEISENVYLLCFEDNPRSKSDQNEFDDLIAIIKIKECGSKSPQFNLNVLIDGNGDVILDPLGGVYPYGLTRMESRFNG
jgi:hypothetical protein